MSAKANAILGWGAGAVMIASIVGGLILVGGPGEARERKEDKVRLNSLATTAKAISCYSDNIGALPDSIEPIKAAILDVNSNAYTSERCRSLKWKLDPVSQKEFEYIRIADHEYKLCAIFSHPSEANPNIYREFSTELFANNGLIGFGNARKDAGRHCYTARDWDKDADY